ncbi:cytoplasmic protein [Multifurca ochricompacta]|uniref:Cytoplasmic protein n=1 Tax=Multifurca ochricompacta TaxID=376703 RepID=A0AAD4M9M5_9AGAM|nr:cytoplasmic protein [Multifurca ochricompacta]
MTSTRREDIIAFQFSSWYPIFSSLSIKSTILPLDNDFKLYLEADGVFVPTGSEDLPPNSTLSLEECDAHQDSDDEATSRYAFPQLDAQVRAVIREYHAVFPKLNFPHQRHDAAWLLPSTSPLKCTSPADVYLLLKSSDFITHDLSADLVFEGCVDNDDAPGTLEYRLELVLRKWFAIDRSREMRAFVRDGVLLGISQRDMNYYEFLNEPEMQKKIVSSFSAYWAAHIKSKWTGPASYTFDVLLTRDLTRFHIIDFNPYAPRTDALLFTYNELAAFPTATPPTLRVIDSHAHPAVTRNAPEHQHNMVPLEALALSQGRNVEEFAAAWADHVRRGTAESDDESEE